jgi:hypothetical protein
MNVRMSQDYAVPIGLRPIRDAIRDPVAALQGQQHRLLLPPRRVFTLLKSKPLSWPFARSQRRTQSGCSNIPQVDP